MSASTRTTYRGPMTRSGARKRQRAKTTHTTRRPTIIVDEPEYIIIEDSDEDNRCLQPAKKIRPDDEERKKGFNATVPTATIVTEVEKSVQDVRSEKIEDSNDLFYSCSQNTQSDSNGYLTARSNSGSSRCSGEPAHVCNEHNLAFITNTPNEQRYSSNPKSILTSESGKTMLPSFSSTLTVTRKAKSSSA